MSRWAPRTQGRSKSLPKTCLVSGGAQVAVDVTLRCVLSCEGEAHPHAADTDGAVLLKARADKEMAPGGGNVRPLQIGCHGRSRTGGRWSDEAAEMIRLLSHAKAREAPSYMRCQVALMWERRWTRMLSVTCASAFAASLVEPAKHVPWCRTGGETLLLADLFESDPR